MRQNVGRRVVVGDEVGMATRLRCRPSRRRRRNPRVRELWLVRVRRHVVEVQVAKSLLVGVYGHRHSVMIGGDGRRRRLFPLLCTGSGVAQSKVVVAAHKIGDSPLIR